MNTKETIRRNENCVIGLPRCDYVFNSSRSCFVAYGFEESPLEMEILRSILKEKHIEMFEAGTSLEPGKNAFCVKICSKIITSQFCIVLLNDVTKGDGIKVPSANVNMEYGLMLGFNKYVIPFQRQNDNLPFNVSGLDTIKYTNSSFRDKAEKAIDVAIAQTKPKVNEVIPVDKIIESFLLVRDAFIDPIDNIGTKNIMELGKPFGYYLLNDYSGLNYYYLGVFNIYSLENIKWRINKLEQVVTSRFSLEALNKKLQMKIIDELALNNALELFNLIKSWIIVQTEEEKKLLTDFVAHKKIRFEIFSLEEINKEIEAMGVN